MIFDQYSRYRAVALACTEAINNISSETIITDVGSGPYRLLHNFLPNYKINYIDPLLANITPAHTLENLFPYDFFIDFEKLKDIKSNLVVSVDTFEHIPSNKRDEFLDKIFSLSSDTIIMAFPCCDTEESYDVDVFVNNFFKNTFGESYSWLSEHFEYGLPSSEKTADFFKSKGLNICQFRQGNSAWLKEILPTVLALNEFNFLNNIVEQQSQFFNTHLAPFDLGQTGYRSIIIASKNELNLENILPKSQPLESDLHTRVEQIKRTLVDHSFFPALAKLRTSLREFARVEQKSVEIGEWGLSLQRKVADLETQILNLSNK